MSHKVKIGNFNIGDDCPPFIVAEAGINHNGDLEKAYDMIKTAKDSGASAVKFQTFKADEFIIDASQTFTYQSQGKSITESMLEMFRRYEFNRDQWKLIKNYCDKIGILFLSTPQNRSDLELLLDLDIPAIKVGSDDLTNIPLIRDYAKTGLPIILSGGMSNLGEVYNSLEAIKAFDGYPVILLHCTSEYPCPPESINLSKILSLKSSFPMIPIGFSDHSQGPQASSIAAALGASFFEKHFTLDNDLPGPDHWFSENPNNLSLWVHAINNAKKMMGSSLVRPTATELKNKKEFQRVLVATVNISEGEFYCMQNIGMRRVSGGKGLPPSFWDFIINRPANRNYKKGDSIEI